MRSQRFAQFCIIRNYDWLCLGRCQAGNHWRQLALHLVKVFGKLHAKCLIIDRQRVLSGSFNWTDSAAERNIELLISFQNSATVKDFTALFERLWEKGVPMKDE